MKNQIFHIGAILTITTGKMITKQHGQSALQLAALLPIQTNPEHDLLKAFAESRVLLKNKFPDLAAVDCSDLTKLNVTSWLERQCEKFGTDRVVQLG